MNHFENIIIGAGHNGLVCAAMLARAGQSALLVESADVVGGLAACREFHPGFSAPVAHTASHFSGVVAKNLNLVEHGLRPAPVKPLIGLSQDGNHVVLKGENLSGVSTGDLEAWTVRPWWDGVVETGPHHQVGEVETHSLNPQMHLAGARVAQRNLPLDQHLGRAVAALSR